MARLGHGEPGSDPAAAGGGDKARRLGPPDAAVLALLYGCPLRVAAILRPCRPGDPWRCDPALPGGRLRRGEDPVEAALREAWEEAGVPGGLVRVYGEAFRESTRAGRVVVSVVLASARGPLELRPGPEARAALWIPLSIAGEPPRLVRHQERGYVLGVPLAPGAPLWGFTLRVLRRLYRWALRGLLPPQALDELCPRSSSQPQGPWRTRA